MTSIDSTNNDLPSTRNVLKKILEYTVEGVAIIGNDKRIEYVNDRVCAIIGRSRDEILGQSFLRFIHPDSADLVEKRYTSRLDGETIPPTYETVVLRDNDEPRNLQVRTTVLTNGENQVKILAQLLDVTEALKTQCSLSEYVMKYSTLMEAMNEGLGVIDDDGILVHANAALCKMLEYTEKELVGKTTVDIMHGFTLDAVFDKIKERIAGKSSRYETSLIHRSGRLIPTMVSASPLFSEEGEYKGSFAIFTDIIKQKMIEKNLQTARDRSLLYLDLMGHDLRNHLQDVQVATELLQYIVEDSSARDLIESILHAVSRSSRIISETKTIEKLAELPFCEKLLDVVLNEIVMAAIDLLDDVEFRMSIQVSEAKVRADEYLELLLSDMLTNAYEHNIRDDKRVWINLTEGETSYELVISDNGPGMPDNLKNGLFDAHQRSGGLRLQLAHYIIEKYGGTLKVLNRIQGEPSQGSKIKVIFPKLL
ncbi:MAG: PAS domain S-box protein [Candidatus Thorarchaeota archaeon]